MKGLWIYIIDLQMKTDVFVPALFADSRDFYAWGGLAVN